MEINVGGGGQAAELGDMGGCGQGAFWACFLHEFGHQVGLSHAGGPLWGMCPTYTSLMSYAYSYGFNDDGNQIHYSKGEFANLILNETKLVERLPFPLDRVRFLEKGPYRFKLEADGDATKVDWNRNGVFDEGTVRADIDDVYGVGTNRFGMGDEPPVLVTDQRGQLLMFGVMRDGGLRPDHRRRSWPAETDKTGRAVTPRRERRKRDAVPVPTAEGIAAAAGEIRSPEPGAGPAGFGRPRCRRRCTREGRRAVVEGRRDAGHACGEAGGEWERRGPSRIP
jgi:hypothetical protein